MQTECLHWMKVRIPASGQSARPNTLTMQYIVLFSHRTVQLPVTNTHTKSNVIRTTASHQWHQWPIRYAPRSQ